jgi:peptidyl-prolyl cis-trans isomerase SurA
MKVKIFLFMLIAVVSIFLISCSSNNITKEENVKVDTLALVSSDVISLKQFEDFYLKNNGGTSALASVTEESKKEFLDLLIKYRLKINDAYSKGYDKDPLVVEEIKEYEKSLAIPYALDKEIIEPAVKVSYERRQHNLKVYAIMLHFNANIPEDTLKAYNLIHSLIDSLNRGANFKELAHRYSDIGTGSPADSGLLGYLSSGQTVMNFENAVYSLKPGEYTKKPVKLATGYIVPMVELIEPRSGGRLFSHLHLEFKNNTFEDSLQVFNLANELKQKLDEGANFEDLVKQYSDDENSKNNGGMLGVYERNPGVEDRMPDFWNAAFALKVGETSKPVTTFLGVHILKCVQITPFPSYEEYKQKLREEYTQSLRYNEDNKNYLNRLKTRYKFTTNFDAVNEFYRGIDSTKRVGSRTWDSLVTDQTRHKTLITLTDEKFSVDSIVGIINNSNEFSEYKFTPSRFQSTLDRIGERIVLEHDAKFVPSRYPEFKTTMREYIDGILLYKAEQEAVWNNLVIDDDALRTYYETRKEAFKFSDRAEISEIFVRSDSLAKEIYRQLTDTVAPPTKKGAKPKKIVPPSFEEMAGKYTEREGYKEKKGYWGLLEETDNLLAMHAIEYQKENFITKPIVFEHGWSIVKVHKIHKPVQKSFEECGPELSTRYQEYETKRLESIWMEDMQAKFPVKTFPEKLKKAFYPETK